MELYQRIIYKIESNKPGNTVWNKIYSNLTLAAFIPHQSENSVSKDLIEEIVNYLEELQFSQTICAGYQMGTKLAKNVIGESPF